MKFQHTPAARQLVQPVNVLGNYCQQLSREMGLTTATISRHMSLLLEAGLVRARKGESRIYYTIDREAVAALCDAVYTTLLPEQLH